MVNVAIRKLVNPERLSFDVKFLDEETGMLALEIRGCTVCKGHLNGPALKIGNGWVPVNTFGGTIKSAILKALEPWHAQYPGVQFPKEA